MFSDLLIPITVHAISNAIAGLFLIPYLFIDKNISFEVTNPKIDIFIPGILGFLVLIPSAIYLFKYITKNWPKSERKNPQ